MKPKHPYALFAMLLAASVSTKNLKAQCCQPPDSLKVKSVTDSSFCVQWLVNDSLHCDSAKAFQINYRPVNATAWTSVIQFYHHDTVYVFCDTGTACVKYQWKARNACVHNGDTIFSAWVMGPKFTLTCSPQRGQFTNGSSLLREHVLVTKPNPTQNNLTLSGQFTESVKVTITSMSGKKMFDKTVVTPNGKLHLTVNVTNFEKGMYFITLEDGNSSLKTTFLKE